MGDMTKVLCSWLSMVITSAATAKLRQQVTSGDELPYTIKPPSSVKTLKLREIRKNARKGKKPKRLLLPAWQMDPILIL